MTQSTTGFVTETTDEVSADLLSIVTRIEKISVEESDVISSNIYTYQPFLLSLLMGNRKDLHHYEGEEMMKNYFIIWEYYKSQRNIKLEKITAKKYEKIALQNFRTYKSIGKMAKLEQSFLQKNSQDSAGSKLILSCLLQRFATSIPLKSMPQIDQVKLILSLKSLISCFDNIVGVEEL